MSIEILSRDQWVPVEQLVDAAEKLRERKAFLVEGLAHEEYLKLSNMISASGYKALLERSPAFYRAQSLVPTRPTKAQMFGTLGHNAVLEPHRYLSKVKVEPDFGDMRLKVNKEARAAWLLDVPPDAVLVTQEQADDLRGMVDAIQKHPIARNLLSNGKAELSGFFVDPLTGMPSKFRPDYLRADGIIADYKTTEDASVQNFMKGLGNWQYDFQAAFYLFAMGVINGTESEDYAIVAQEKEAPYQVMVYSIPVEMLREARKHIDIAREIYAECVARNQWPTYPTDIVNAFVPIYIQRQRQESFERNQLVLSTIREQKFLPPQNKEITSGN